MVDIAAAQQASDWTQQVERTAGVAGAVTTQLATLRAPAEDTQALGTPTKRRARDVTQVSAPAYWAPLCQQQLTRTSPDHDPGLPCTRTSGHSSGIRLTGGPAHNYGSAAEAQPRTTGRCVNGLPPSPLAGIQTTQQEGPGPPTGPWLGV